MIRQMLECLLSYQWHMLTRAPGNSFDSRDPTSPPILLVHEIGHLTLGRFPTQ